MGILDGLRGRHTPGTPDLDGLFDLPRAAEALRAATGFAPDGAGAVCHRLVEGGAFGAFGRAQRDVARLLRGDPGRETGLSAGPHGWGWAHVTRPPDAFDRLVADLHMVGATLTAAGYGPYLLCSVTCFRRDEGAQRLLLVHSPGRGTFYPFAPRPPSGLSEEGGPGARRGRNNLVETRAREALTGELAIEPDTARWFPVWDAPGLS
ncbi:PspA-associated protein PspAB [Actinomadura welshii]